MHATFQRLLSTAPVLLDGAWGTQLQARGLPVGACPDLWNLHQPGRVAEVAHAYVAAGSRIILTNTFGANRFVLARHGADHRVEEINREGARISRDAAADRASVFGSVGPTGKMLAMGEVTPDEMLAAFREQIQGLAEGGVDAVVVETMSDLEEAELAVRAAVEAGLPAAASMTFGAGREGDRTMMGHTPEEAAGRLAAVGAQIIGANCGFGPEQMLPVCRRLAQATALPLWMKPNAGLPVMVEGRAAYTLDAETFAAHAAKLLQAGARFIGGCCGTGPEYIAALKRLLTK